VSRTLPVILLAAAATLHAQPSRADDAQIARGKYLVTLAGCNDCHTPGFFFGKPDSRRELAGSDVGFEVPGVGVVAGPNLTPDNETGLGRWTAQQIATAIRSGVRPDGRVLSPVMPWPTLSKLTEADTVAMVAYLQQLPPVRNKVPGSLRPGEPAPMFIWKLTPPGKQPGVQ
jgi:mono/diheme cytochrome c family protein